MKSQDILLLLKLISLRKDEALLLAKVPPREQYLRPGWQGWADDGSSTLMEGDLGVTLDADLSVLDIGPETTAQRYSIRSLAVSTGISKSEVSASLNRSYRVGLARNDRKTGLARVNTRALVDLIVHGIRYVFPAEVGPVSRGIPTAFAAPILESSLATTGELVPVWPDPYGRTKGQAITPLYKSVPYAVRRDPFLYSLLALTDAIRIGGVREASIAAEILKKETQNL